MNFAEEDVLCRNCSESLFQVLRRDDGAIIMKNAGNEPESDGFQRYFRCPNCQGKNLAMLVEDRQGNRYYELAGFIRP